jgi:hypothetical protein
MISADAYMRLKHRDRLVLVFGEVPDDMVAAIRATKMHERNRRVADLIPDWTS